MSTTVLIKLVTTHNDSKSSKMMRIKAHMLMILSLQLSLPSVYGFLNLGSSLISPNKPFSRVEKPQELFAHTNNKSDGSLFSSFLNQLSNDRNNNNTMKQKEIPSKNQQTSRRNALLRFAVVATTASTTMDIMSSLDNGNIARAADTKSTIWLTGKAPKVPGEKPKDKNDTKGTRKDPNFLRSVADCKGSCERGYGPDGFAKSKEDCLSECQDICCTTYEQCTFAIVPRL